MCTKGLERRTEKTYLANLLELLISLQCLVIFNINLCQEERYSHRESFTTASRPGHIVVIYKVLALRYIKTFCKYIEFGIKP